MSSLWILWHVTELWLRHVQVQTKSYRLRAGLVNWQTWIRIRECADARNWWKWEKMTSFQWFSGSNDLGLHFLEESSRSRMVQALGPWQDFTCSRLSGASIRASKVARVRAVPGERIWCGCLQAWHRHLHAKGVFVIWRRIGVIHMSQDHTRCSNTWHVQNVPTCVQFPTKERAARCCWCRHFGRDYSKQYQFFALNNVLWSTLDSTCDLWLTSSWMWLEAIMQTFNTMVSPDCSIFQHSIRASIQRKQKHPHVQPLKAMKATYLTYMFRRIESANHGFERKAMFKILSPQCGGCGALLHRKYGSIENHIVAEWKFEEFSLRIHGSFCQYHLGGVRFNRKLESLKNLWHLHITWRWPGQLPFARTVAWSIWSHVVLLRNMWLTCESHVLHVGKEPSHLNCQICARCRQWSASRNLQGNWAKEWK